MYRQERERFYRIEMREGINIYTLSTNAYWTFTDSMGICGGYVRNEVPCLFCGEGRVYVSCGEHLCVYGG